MLRALTAPRAGLPRSRLLQATGLALPGSDLDIVVLNVGATLDRAATGFTPVQVGSRAAQEADPLGVDALQGAQLRRCASGPGAVRGSSAGAWVVSRAG